MKTGFNLTTYPDELACYESAEDLRQFYEQFGCSGLEIMPYEAKRCDKLTNDMITGVHCRCISDWLDHSWQSLLDHYRQDLAYAREVEAEYVVFHITQISYMEFMTHKNLHTDEEVIEKSCCLINELLDGEDYSFYFLMENLWHPGLTFLRPEMTQKLLDGIHYEKKGLMLDTGHFMNTNPSLRTPEEALQLLHSMLDMHEKFLPMIHGIHLHQSLSGAFVEDFIANPPVIETDLNKLASQCFSYVFMVDQHRPFCVPGVRELVERISPDFLTYEYITRSREELAEFLKAGSAPFRD